MALLAAGVASPPARADGLAPDETSRLLRGETVARTQEMHRGTRRYVGGVAYTIVDCAPSELGSVLQNVDAWRRFLPKTRDARRVGTVDGDPLVQITHGSPLVQVGYTLRVHPEEHGLRFWMDPSLSHDIEDAWGFFRTEALGDGRTLVTYGILIDMGGGLLRDMFEDRVRELALEVPTGVRDVVLRGQAARGRRAAR
jgi:hypothetical protein